MQKPKQIGELSLYCGVCQLPITEIREWVRGSPCKGCGYQGLPDYQVRLRDAHNLSEADIIDQLFYQLAGHCNPGHSPIDTLNRLVQKHFQGRFNKPYSGPTLIEEALKAEFQWWSTADLTQLWRGHNRINPGPYTEDDDPRKSQLLTVPVALLRLGDVLCVADGNNRINRWLEDEIVEPRPCYLVEAIQPTTN